MKEKETKVCNKCHKTYTGYHATSRVDGSEICSDCGTREALTSLRLNESEIERIIEIIHQSFIV